MGSSKVNCKREKLLSCVFLTDVLCPRRKSEREKVMDECFSCPHYLRFMKEMDEADEAMMDEIDFIREYGYEMYDTFYKKRKGGV